MEPSDKQQYRRAITYYQTHCGTSVLQIVVQDVDSDTSVLRQQSLKDAYVQAQTRVSHLSKSGLPSPAVLPSKTDMLNLFSQGSGGTGSAVTFQGDGVVLLRLQCRGLVGLL